MKTPEAAESCPTCEKPLPLCVCSAVEPLNNRVFVLILRHPQEQDRVLGTARLTALQLKNSKIKTGLSWGNLTKIINRPADPKRWGVLYLGTTKGAQPSSKRVLSVITKKGDPAPDQNERLENLEGIILLDGNWSQAKALWWRNPWLLKCQRIVLQPPRPSLYGNLRKEPRRESVSTIEAAAFTLAELEHAPELVDHILQPFKLLLEKARKNNSR